MNEALLIDAVRTPRARKKGKYAGVHPVDLMTYPLNALVQRNSLKPEFVEDVLLGCVTQTQEQGWCVARQSVLAAGWPISVPASTVNRLCASGQQASNFGALGLKSGAYSVVVTGGIEHMTRVPMFSDVGGEESPLLKKHHPDLVQQGLAAELLSKEFRISRDDADTFSYQSQMKAKKALEGGYFKKSLVPVSYKAEDGSTKELSEDDTVRGETTLEALRSLKPAFKEDGIVTAGNASAIVDGACALLWATEERAKELGLKPRARLVECVSIGSDPLLMLTGPVEASRQVLKKAKLKKDDIDVWEINEAFAPVPILTLRELDIDPARVNPNGGGISLGHPLGATGAMLLNMAIDELERTQKRYALVTMCIGLGMGTATIIERL